MKTKAAVLTKLNSPLEILDLSIPKLERGHVLVKILTAGICGSQKLEIKGWKNNEKFLPHMMGHEGCGIVQEVGKDVTKVIQGQKVVLHWRIGSGIEAPFIKYDHVGAGKVTTFSEYAVVSENRVTPINNNIAASFGALLGCSFTTAYGAVFNEAKVQLGDNILVIGCGGVGRPIVDAASLLHPNIIKVFDIRHINDLPANVVNVCHASEHKYDIIFDTVGNTDTLNHFIKQLCENGKYIILGQGDPTKTTNIFSNDFFGKTIIFSQGGNTNPDKDIPLYTTLYRLGDIKFDHLISHTYPLEEVNAAIEQLSKVGTKRIILNIS